MEWLSNLWDKVTSIFSDEPADSPATPCDGALSPEEAQALHDEMAAQDDIPFDYAPDCCYARAQRMSRLMARMGIASKKAWAYGSMLSPLSPVDTSGNPISLGGRQVQWGYHVAPTVLVRGADGVCRDMVIDPSLRDHPMTVDEWEGIMGGARSSATTGPNVYYRNPAGGEMRAPPPAEVDATFAEHRASLAAARGR
ncbi:protein-glutamine glutaminase family protein [Yoonia sp. 2307UL14-13]|uniref:protein-glutamine glutaminase family protein n=1 Tax=Yoonia sp. 2307UL14-13 TaxID=3126506 RepID=UPI00309C447C